MSGNNITGLACSCDMYFVHDCLTKMELYMWQLVVTCHGVASRDRKTAKLFPVCTSQLKIKGRFIILCNVNVSVMLR